MSKLDKLLNDPRLKTMLDNARTTTIAQVLHSSSASDWLKCALADALLRDPVDAASDAETLYLLLDQRAEEALNQ